MKHEEVALEIQEYFDENVHDWGVKEKSIFIKSLCEVVEQLVFICEGFFGFFMTVLNRYLLFLDEVWLLWIGN